MSVQESKIGEEIKKEHGTLFLVLPILLAYFAKGKEKKKNQYTTDEREMKQMKHKCG